MSIYQTKGSADVLSHPGGDSKKAHYPKWAYSWGQNIYGQLGRERCNEPVSLPGPIPVEVMCTTVVNVKKIVVSAVNTFILTEAGEVYGNGMNNVQQVDGGRFLDHKFEKLNSLEDYDVHDISALWDTCFAVTKQGIAIGWGANTYGQLGRDPSEMFSTRNPVELYSATPVVQVEGGERHCAVMTKQGRVLTCGDSRKGQLGRPNQLYDYELREIPTMRNARKIAVGQYHNVALVKRNGILTLFTWGWNREKQCGAATAQGDIVSIPTQIAFPVPIAKGSLLKCGWNHSALGLLTGELYLWGDNSLGQQGLDSSKSSEPLPKKVDRFSAVADFGLGYGHTVVLLPSGMIASWGENSENSCGLGHSSSPVVMPLTTCVGLKRISTRVFAGYKQSFALTV